MQLFDMEVKRLREHLCSHLIKTGEIDQCAQLKLREWLKERRAGRGLPAMPTEFKGGTKHGRPAKPNIKPPKTQRRRGVRRYKPRKKDVATPIVHMAW